MTPSFMVTNIQRVNISYPLQFEKPYEKYMTQFTNLLDAKLLIQSLKYGTSFFNVISGLTRAALRQISDTIFPATFTSSTRVDTNRNRQSNAD